MNAGRIAQVIAGLVVLVLAAFVIAAGKVPTLRTAHARPAAATFTGEVAITPAGRLFHDPRCPLIHGPAQRLDAAEAEREGYTPCPRCLARAFRKTP